MMANAKKIKWDKVTEALPSFVTIFIVPFSFNLLRGAAFGYVTWGVLSLFNGEVYRNFYELYLELRGMVYGDDIPSASTEDGSEKQIIDVKDSHRWFQMLALSFGDTRLPKSKFDLSTVVHSNSAMDIPSLEQIQANENALRNRKTHSTQSSQV